MINNRREFLITTGAAMLTAGVGCRPADSDSDAPTPREAPERTPEPDPWVPEAALEETEFPSGIQVGDVTADSAKVGAYAGETAVTLVLAAGDSGSWVEVQRATLSVATEQHFAHDFAGLRADTPYSVVAVSADGARRSHVSRFRTAPAPGTLRKVVLGASSCFGDADTSFVSARHVAAQRPDAFLLLGDSVYADGSDGITSYRRCWRAFLENPSIRELFAATSVIATWDDHEVANNWTLGDGGAQSDHVDAAQLEAAINAFREAIPQRTGPEGSGFWRSLRFGDIVEFIVLDSRGERDGETRIVSDAQLAWAAATIRASTTVFQCVLASVHVTDHTALFGAIEADDRWQGYPEQRAALVAAIREKSGCFILTGDMHYGGVQRIDPEAEDRWEIAVGPAGSTLFPVEAVAEIQGGPPPQYDLLLEAWTSTLLTLDPVAKTVTIAFLDNAGDTIGHRILTF